ncbi:hypothetical protein IFM61606_01728 [Aspergillus udagawae]|uniref:Uncharacterized protein n=1 Tax=Aspergillus udagawae TaxID=91492 RepID=A0A8E0QYL6_9EURO|nr:uncharacterized protein Aud_008198 [Aspergillus udagawae]GFF39173.1 hypothetical protein IFM51744_04041 [Aspergillus udagawae]GFF69375.1 hypothetical protein IFM53868_00039 [Aspergillus udagawae]GFG15438.1 hypothetical protein IFM5058_07453 [Aspergillus udagawae]GFG21876.1 hypothetical protein IFM61606_01728 [Aspergillus udagawae]GIC91744.1 hypothetical protein Aud_008198 [Aspergillus udagawae]
MHFTNYFLALLAIVTPSLASSAPTARIWAEFFPSCPVNRIHPASAPDHLPHEEFISALDISPGNCTNIFVPLSYGREVTHMSFDAEVEVEAEVKGTRPEKCSIAVHEVPGCVDPPLLKEEVKHGFASSDCVPRNFVSYNQVWVRLDCEEAEDEAVQPTVQPGHRRGPLLHDLPHLHVNKSIELANQTAPFSNGTGSSTAARPVSLRRALRIRL